MSSGAKTIAVGLGSASGGAEFAKLTGFPAASLFADPESACHKAMGFSPGFLGESDMNGYAKIFPMLAGIGSPGTLQVCYILPQSQAAQLCPYAQYLRDLWPCCRRSCVATLEINLPSPFLMTKRSWAVPSTLLELATSALSSWQQCG